MDARIKEVISQLGKQAAYQPSYILPPKKVTSRSRTVKVRPQNKPAVSVTPDATANNQSQSPYRYGRRKPPAMNERGLD